MDRAQKLLGRISKKNLSRIKVAIGLLIAGKVEGMKLKGKNLYRFRVGDYRILYEKDKNKNILIVEVRKRDERTYK